MAPWPEQGNEPKAPDKNSDKCENIPLEELKSRNESAETQDSNNLSNKLDQNHWNKGCDSVVCGAESDQFRELDEGQLKALLDEAITYKSPKDRENKSELFKELLQKAEADESDCSDETAAAAVASTGPNIGSRSHFSGSRFSNSKKKHGKREVGVAERQRSGGSLQNLVHAFRGTSGRQARDHVTGSVSARQREGGSLPTNVNVQGVESEDVTHSTELVCNYTTRATLQVSDDPHHVDVAVSFPITSKQSSTTLNSIEQTPLPLHSPYNSVMGSNYETRISSAAESTTMLCPVQHVSFLSIPPQQISAGLDMSRLKLTKDGSSEKKTVDENGNALASNRLETVTSDRKSKRRLKMKNYRNIVTAENIEGYRGEDNIDSLIQYIESPSGNSLEQNKTSKARQTNGPTVSLVGKGTRGGVNKLRAKEDEGRKRRSKETKIHKCNSLEEISKTKLEDLTSPSSNAQEETGRARPRKQVTLDDAQLSVRSLDEQSNIVLGESFSPSCIKKKEEAFSDDCCSTLEGKKKKEKKPEIVSESVPGNEFHLVQKKQRRKKRQVTMAGRTNSGKVGSGGGYYGGRSFSTHDRVERDGRSLYRYRHSTGPQESVHPRRKSASSVPPSDNSDCSDDGSVCSLPVSSTTPRPNVGKTSTSGGSTPQASYADIARSVTSPPRATCTVSIPRRSTPASTVPSSAASSGIGDEETSASPELVVCTKKDAMTDTNLDSFLPIEEYPPLKGPSSDLIFVEYTLKRGRLNRESSVSVEETIVVKNNAYQNSQKSSNCNDSSVSVMGCTKTFPVLVGADTTPNANKRPPVILLDEDRASPQSTSVAELTFGFEVNHQLLNDDNTTPSSSPQAEAQPPSFPNVNYPAFDRMINYIKSSWASVQQEFEADKAFGGTRVQYYSGQ